MKHKPLDLKRFLTWVAALGVSWALQGCGGGAGSPAPPAPGPLATAPAFTASPADATAFSGTRPMLSATVTGSPAPVLQWQRSNDGVNWTDVPGASAAVLTLPTLTDADDGARFRVVASNPAGQVASSSATLRLNKSLGVLAGLPGGTGFSDGVGEQARFNVPSGLAIAPDGVWTVLDGDLRLRQVTAEGRVTTLYGPRYGVGAASVMAVLPSGDWLLAHNAVTQYLGGFVTTAFISLERVSRATGAVTVITDQVAFSAAMGMTAPVTAMTALAVDAQGRIYMSGSYAVYRIDTQGTITSLAGAPYQAGSSDGSAAQARFDGIASIAVDSAGRVYVADSFNHTLRKIDTNGQVGTLAGQAGSKGSADGAGATARLNNPISLALDTDGSLLVVDRDNYTLRRVHTDGFVTTLAGTAQQRGTTNGPRDQARLQRPIAVAVSPQAGIAVLDDQLVRLVGADGSIKALAGRGNGEGNVDGIGTAARFNMPQGVAIDSQGTIAVADTSNNLLRRVTADGSASLLAGTRQSGSPVVDGPLGTGNFSFLTDVATGPEGSWFVADNNKIRRVAVDGALTTLGGDFSSVGGLAYASNGGLIVSDASKRTVSRMSTSGSVTLLAGQANVTGSQNGSGANATFEMPQGIALDAAGNVFVTDYHTIRKIDAAGVVTTLAGAATRTRSVDGDRTTAGFEWAQHLAVDAAGQLLVCDGPNRLRRIAPDGTVTTVYTGVRLNGVAIITPGRAVVVDESALVLIKY